MNEFKINYPMGSSVFAVVFNPAGQIWNTANGAFQALTLAAWDRFQIPLYPQAMPTMYWGSFPAAITTAGNLHRAGVRRGRYAADRASPARSAGTGFRKSRSTLSTAPAALAPATAGRPVRWLRFAQLSASMARSCPPPGGDLQTAMRRAFALMVNQFGIKTEADLAQLQQVLTATD